MEQRDDHVTDWDAGSFGPSRGVALEPPLTASPLDSGRQLRARLEEALAAADERASRRLGSAGTSVTFEVADVEGRSVTILLDRFPPEVTNGGEPAEISIELTPEQARALADGELDLPGRLLSGEIPFRGKPRDYLAVHPILCGLLS